MSNLHLQDLNWGIMHQSISAAPIPPGQLRGICGPCQSRGWGISKFGVARGSGICLPPGFWHARGFQLEIQTWRVLWERTSSSRRLARRRLARPAKLRTGQTCGGFLDFMHFCIAYQGTTWNITIYTEIGNDQHESTYACFIDQGFKWKLVAVILKLLWSIIKF